MNTQHMGESNDYGFAPVGGGVCKETDLSVMKAAICPRMEHLAWCNTEKSYMFGTEGYISTMKMSLPLQNQSIK